MSTYIDIVFEGNKFSPKFLLERIDLPIETIAEYGEVGKIGRYKGKPMPYGLALMKLSGKTSEDINEQLDRVINLLYDNKSIVKKSGVDEITLDLENNSVDNFEIVIDKNILIKLAELNGKIEFNSVNYVEGDNHFFHHDVYISQLYSSLRNESLFIDMSKKQKDKIDYIFRYKMNNSKKLEINLSSIELTSSIVSYLLKYIKSRNLDKIPTFEETLK